MDKQIVDARKVTRGALKKDEGTRRGYRDNIACILMDNIPGLKRGKKAIDRRNEIADMIISRIFG